MSKQADINSNRAANDLQDHHTHKANDASTEALLRLLKGEIDAFESSCNQLQHVSATRVSLDDVKTQVEQIDPSLLNKPQKCQKHVLLAVVNKHLGAFDEFDNHFRAAIPNMSLLSGAMGVFSAKTFCSSFTADYSEDHIDILLQWLTFV